MLQKFHDSIALCSKKDTCSEDRANFQKHKDRFNILVEDLNSQAREISRKVRILEFSMEQTL